MLKEAAPGHLAVYLSDRCNLACGYCYVSVNEGPAARLDWPALSRALDRHLEDAGPERARVTFLGGEPLLDFPLLRRAVLRLRRASPGLPVAVFTNGLLLDPPKARFLLDRKVRVIVSLDGEASDNDASRRPAARGGGSVHEALARRLRELPAGLLEANMVVTAAAAHRLPENALHVASFGFRSLALYPDLRGRWTGPAARRLERALGRLAALYRERLSRDGRPPFLLRDAPLAAQRAERPGWWRRCENLALGPDGRYYACDKALGVPSSRADPLAAGRVATGPDWDARRRLLESAAAEADRLAPGEKFLHCPMGPVLRERLDGGPAAAALESFRRASAALRGFYAALAAPAPATL